MRIVVDIMNTRVLFDKEEEAIKKRFLRDMHQKLGVKVDGFFFSPAYKSGHWDGIQDFYDFKTNTFPTGLLPQVQEILGAMQNDAVFQFEIIDDRPDPFLTVEDLDSEITLIGDDGGNIQLRDYQYDSVKSIIENYSGIINIATNGGKCLYQFTKLLTKNGYRTIGSLFTDAGIDLYQSETTIDNTFGIELINRYGQVEKPSHLTINGTKHVNKVTTEKGWEEIITDNHPLLTVASDGTHQWKEAKDLVVGDWVVARKGDNIYGDSRVCNTDDAYALGTIIADGYIGIEAKVQFSNDQPELLGFMQNYLQQYGHTCRIPRKKGTSEEVILSDKKATIIFHNKYSLGYGVAKDKVVPQCILEAPKEVQLAFLSGYLECEMSIEVPKCAIEVTSASKELLEQVQLMLLNMGYVANLSEKRVKSYEDNWYGRLTLGALDSAKLLNELTFITEQRQTQREAFYEALASRKRNPKGQTTPFGKELVRAYKDTYPNPPKGMKKAFDFPKTISIDRLRELVAKYPNGLPKYKLALDNLLDEQFVYSQVVSIEDAGYEPTFDLHMPETHSFIANGMINHNTEIASGIIQQILPHLESGERIAFFTHSSSIFNQSIDRIEKRLGIKVGRLGNGKKDIRQVTFVMIPTLTASLKDPEVGLKLTHKERVIKKLAKEVVPRFTMQKNHRKLLNIYIENNRPKNKVEEDIKARLEDLLYSCGTDSEVLMGLKGFNAEYEKIIEKKNKKLYDKNKQAREFLSSVSVMIADEAHHTSSETWYNSLMSCENAMYRVALTGSIDKENKMLWQRMQGVFGQITARTSNETLITLGHSAKPTIKIFPIKAPTDIENVDNYATAYEKGIVENDYRNLLIAKLAKMWYDKDKGVLIIVNRIEHGNRLSELLESLEVSHYFIHGDLDIDLREQQLQNMRDGKLKVMISTSIVDEGVDISGIDALILGAGGKSLRQTLQRVGRALRKKKQGENTCQVFDFKDMTHRFLLSHSDQRRQIYVDENFEIQDI